MSGPTVVMQNNGYNNFDEDAPRYKCCCGCMHVKTGAIVIGVLEILGALSNIGGQISQQVQGKSTGMQGSIYYGVGGATITILVAALLFVGVAQESHAWVLPHLIWQILGIIGLVIGGIIIIVYLCIGGTALGLQIDTGDGQWITADVGSALAILLITTVVILFLVAIFEIWFFVVIFKFYRFCKEKKQLSSATIVQYGNPGVQQPVYNQQAYANDGYSKYP